MQINYACFAFFRVQQPCVEQTTTNRVLTTTPSTTQGNSVSVAIQFLLYLQTHKHKHTNTYPSKRAETDANTHRQQRPSLQLWYGICKNTNTYM